MSVFHFQRFDVENTASAMKLGTDSVLLGACAPIPAGVKNVLDVGTGTGVVALMAAQRLSALAGEFHIDGIDIDAPSAEEAEGNFVRSPWREHLAAFTCPLALWQGGPYDLIVSNPPFFDNSLLNPNERESAARHTLSLSYRDLCEYASEHLTSGGVLSMVLPSEVEKALCRVAASFSLFPLECVRVQTVQSKPSKRIVISFSRHPGVRKDRALVMMENGAYTSQYRELVASFLVNL